MIDKSDMLSMLMSACTSVMGAHDELNEIDGKWGSANQGDTMTMLAQAIMGAASGSAKKKKKNGTDGGIKSLLGDVAEAVLGTEGGGMTAKLLGTWLEGMFESAPEDDSDEMDELSLKDLFGGALKALEGESDAREGDKTLMDTLIPATKALVGSKGGLLDMLTAAAAAGDEGAEKTKKYGSKYGRAAKHGKKTVGTPDAGAMSMKYFLDGMLKALL
ncbi:MAG: DAK2 domain-containing protein [Pyramidobacter sp.]|nr:DAK2 domain-containing protein [Pyramidobacter sp.]